MKIIIKVKGLPYKRQLQICETLTDYIKEETTSKNVFATIDYFTRDSKKFENNNEIESYNEIEK